MQEPTLHEILSVEATNLSDVFVLRIDRTDTFGERATTNYVSVPGDKFGLGPTVRAGCDQWLLDGKPVSPYVAPTVDEVRAVMPALTPRQLRLGLVNGGYSISGVRSEIDGIADPVVREKAQIEWEFASSYARLHPLIGQIGAALSISDTQIDDMWAAAAAL